MLIIGELKACILHLSTIVLDFEGKACTSNGRTDECIHLKMNGQVIYGATKPTTLNEGMYINVSSFISIVQRCITLIFKLFDSFDRHVLVQQLGLRLIWNTEE